MVMVMIIKIIIIVIITITKFSDLFGYQLPCRQYVSCLGNWTVCAITQAPINGFLSLLAKKNWNFFSFDLRKEPYISQILLKLWLIGNRTSCRPIRSVIILVIKQIGLLLCGRPILLITRMITDQIGLHSVLVPLLIAIITFIIIIIIISFYFVLFCWCHFCFF